MGGPKLTDERREKMRALVLDGKGTKDLVGLFPEMGESGIDINVRNMRKQAGMPPWKDRDKQESKRWTGKNQAAHAINEAILRGDDPEAIRAAADRILPSKLGRPAKVELKPMSTEQCKRVLKVLEKIAEADPAAFTNLGIWQTLTAKFPDKLLEVF